MKTNHVTQTLLGQEDRRKIIAGKINEIAEPDKFHDKDIEKMLVELENGSLEVGNSK